MRTGLTIAIIVLAIVVIAAGAVAIWLGQSNSKAVGDRLAAEKVSLRVFNEDAPPDAVVTNADEARQAADTLREHRRNIAPTYSELLGGKRFDATNPEQITYVVGMTLEGQMNLATLAFGLTTALTFFGSVLVVIGVVLLVIGLDVFFYHVRPAKKGAAVV